MKFDSEDVYIPRPTNASDEAKPSVDAREGDAVFTMRGNHDYMWYGIPATNKKETSGFACAKKVRGNYFLRINTYGEIFNPLDDTHVNSAGRMSGNLPTWRYLKVDYTTFAHYAHFLKTRNIAYLAMARREMSV